MARVSKKSKSDESLVFKGKLREEFGRNARVNATERGTILGLLQDSKGTRTYLELQDKEIRKAHQSPAFYNTIFQLEVQDKTPIKCIVRKLDVEPVHDREFRNITLLAYEPGQEVEVDIPIRVMHEDKCPGIKKGGVLNLVLEKIECLCSADTIPKSVDLDLSHLELAQRMMLSDVKLPEGIKVAPREYYKSMPVVTIRPTRASLALDAPKDKDKAAAATGAAGAKKPDAKDDKKPEVKKEDKK